MGSLMTTKNRLEELLQKSRKDFLGGGARKKAVRNVAWNAIELAGQYGREGNVNLEEELLTNWLTLCEQYQTYPIDEIRNRLASLKVNTGDDAQTIALLEERYRQKKKLWPNFANESLSEKLLYRVEHSDRLALAYLRAGNADKAVEIFDEVLSASDIAVGEVEFASRLSQASPFFAIQYGALMQKTGKLEEANQIYQAVLASSCNEYYKVHTLFGLAITKDEAGDQDGALTCFRECESKWYSFPASKSRDWSFPGSMRYAKIVQKTGESKAAETIIIERIENHDRVSQVVWPKEDQSHFGYWLRMTYETYDSPELFLTDFYVNDGQQAKAFAHQSQLIRDSVSYSQLRLAYLPAARRNKYLREQFQPRWMKALSFAKQYNQNAEVANLTAGWLLNGKGIEHDLLAEASFSSNEKFAPLVSELKLIRARMAAMAKDQKELDQSSQQTLNQLKEKQESLESKLVFERVQRTGIEPWVSVESLRSSIPSQASFVSIARVTPYEFVKSFDAVKRIWTAPHYYAWVIPPAGKGEIQFVDLGDARSIDTAIDEVRKEIQQTTATLGQSGEQVSEDRLQNRLQALSALVYRPLEEHVGDASELIISPDGNLWTIPWEMLRKDEKYLIESKAIRYVTSGRELTRKEQSQDKLAPPAIFAAIDYDAGQGSAIRTPCSQPC